MRFIIQCTEMYSSSILKDLSTFKPGKKRDELY